MLSKDYETLLWSHGHDSENVYRSRVRRHSNGRLIALFRMAIEKYMSLQRHAPSLGNAYVLHLNFAASFEAEILRRMRDPKRASMHAAVKKSAPGARRRDCRRRRPRPRVRS